MPPLSVKVARAPVVGLQVRPMGSYRPLLLPTRPVLALLLLTLPAALQVLPMGLPLTMVVPTAKSVPLWPMP